MAKGINYYDILGVPADATADAIKSAYKARIAQYHPDVNHTTHATAVTALINEAYEVLGDGARRALYDLEMGFATRRPSHDAGAGPTTAEPVQTKSSGRRMRWWIAAAVLFVAVDIGYVWSTTQPSVSSVESAATSSDNASARPTEPETSPVSVRRSSTARAASGEAPAADRQAPGTKPNQVPNPPDFLEWLATQQASDDVPDYAGRWSGVFIVVRCSEAMQLGVCKTIESIPVRGSLTVVQSGKSVQATLAFGDLTAVVDGTIDDAGRLILQDQALRGTRAVGGSYLNEWTSSLRGKGTTMTGSFVWNVGNDVFATYELRNFQRTGLLMTGRN